MSSIPTAGNRSRQTPGALAWLIWSLSALSFGYAFFQRVAPSVMVQDLMAEFAVGGAVLGYLSALYFYPYVALQIPLGALLDRFGARALLTVAIALASAGSLLFASATSLEAAYLGRALIGTGSAVGFLGSLTLASRWFPPHRFALLTGAAMFFAMVCGIAGQAPLAWIVEQYGWRAAMYGGGIFAAVLCLLTALIVRNEPDDQTGLAGNPVPKTRISVWQSLKRALGRWTVWHIAIVAASMTGIMLTFGGLWGVPYLMTEFNLPRTEAAFMASFMLFGWAVGAPFFGWLSDRIGRRKLPIVAASGISTVLMTALLVLPGWSPVMATVTLFVIGACSASMVITFALAREHNEAEIQGTVSGIVNAFTVVSGAVLQPLVGYLLDAQWAGTIIDGARVYSPDQYRAAFVSLVAWAGVGFLASLFLKETWCRSSVQKKMITA